MMCYISKKVRLHGVASRGEREARGGGGGVGGECNDISQACNIVIK